MAQFYCLLQINNSDFEVTEEEKLKFVRFATIETLHRDHCIDKFDIAFNEEYLLSFLFP